MTDTNNTVATIPAVKTNNQGVGVTEDCLGMDCHLSNPPKNLSVGNGGIKPPSFDPPPNGDARLGRKRSNHHHHDSSFV